MLDKKNRHERVMRLFDIEEREQELSAIAHAATRDTGEEFGSRALSPHLNDIERDSNADILATHQRLRKARALAERMATEDPELARLNGLAYSSARQVVGEVIDGEAIEVAP
jgi:hypothetical protein